MGNCGGKPPQKAQPAAKTKAPVAVARREPEKRPSPLARPAAEVPSCDDCSVADSEDQGDKMTMVMHDEHNVRDTSVPPRYSPTSFIPDDTSLGLPRDKEMDAIIFVEQLRMKYAQKKAEEQEEDFCS
ncbi:hypothetical protein DIPPA_15728 [Diplonema papillatum]|nr:hypothetical protein DIPPA_15728 [Diplonema papillatum]